MITKAAYTTALYEVSKEKGNLPEVAKDVEMILNLITSNKDLELFFHSPYCQ